MKEGKLIQEVNNAVSWAKNGAFSEKKCVKFILDACKAYAAAQVAAKDAEIDKKREFMQLQAIELNRQHAEIKRLRMLASRILGKNQIYEGFILVSPDTLGEFLSPADGPKIGNGSALNELADEFQNEMQHGDGIEETEEQCRERLNTEARQKVVDAAKADENGLLPCPFCGGKAATKYDNITEWEVMIEVGCHDCRVGFYTLSNVNEKEMATTTTKDQWNYRGGNGA